MAATLTPFWLLTVFSADINGGNPAAVVFMDLTRPTDVYRKIAYNFNQPITTFLAPLSLKDKNKLAFNIRWFSPNLQELQLCGHGTLAAAKIVFESYLMAQQIDELEFHTSSGGTMTARKCDGGFIELYLTAADEVPVSLEEKARLQSVLARTFGREVTINYIACGGESFEHYLMVELNEKENLKELPVDAHALRDSGFPINIFTTASSNKTEKFISRMFAPGLVPGDEDHVCGSAHCVIGPYWYKKLGISRGHEIDARQVSPRGGELKLLWEAEENVLRLKGVTTILAKGELQIA